MYSQYRCSPRAGAGAALLFLAEGHDLVLLSRKRDAVEKLPQKLSKLMLA